ncbi:MAG TPA: UDP-N-acetylmuramoyl-tripeptide--D-alanyl-D-alanine ligase, partial [Gammaproteobacteria bacterium]|nr:UDP-N-acetylmuramoyl-tripeptide--D-alanyl-D-alanine ligase [Gammaproteobacteria bacterium]
MMTLADVARWTGGRPHGEARFRGVTTDTRRLEPGALFVALRGPRFDGHAFLADAAAAGAAGALVERGPAAQAGQADLPRVEVADTGRALLDLARAWRLRVAGETGARVVAITGSCGKTTVKDLTAAALAAGDAGSVLATPGNWNNTVGVPLTLFGLAERHRFAAVEVGINRPGEMDVLADTVRPDVAVITNAAPAHLEGLGSLEAVAGEKGRLLGGLGPEGIAVINADSPFAEQWARAAPGPVLRFGLDAPAEVRGEWRPEGEGGRLWVRSPAGEAELVLALPGRHNAANALAALAAAHALGVPLTAAAAGIEGVRAAAGRLQARAGRGGLTVLDDTYNANPASLEAALDVLASGHGGGRTWAVLGDMGELGAEGAAWHARAGESARERGVDRLIGVGELAAGAAEAFGAAGRAVADWREAADMLAAEAAPGDRVLVKGSR